MIRLDFSNYIIQQVNDKMYDTRAATIYDTFNSYYNSYLSNKYTSQQSCNDTFIFFIQSKQAFHSVPEVKACSSLGGCNILPRSFYSMLCVHGKRLKNVTD